MKKLKHDITKLKTVANYAKSKGVTPTRIYQLEKSGEIDIVLIDGVKFVEV